MATEKELIQAISEIDNVETLRDIFAAIATALRAKGVEKNPIYPEEFADLIGTIETGIDTDDATAISSDILKDKTAYARGEKLVGTLKLGVNTDDADAQATDIASGKTAYVKGAKVTGSIPEVSSGMTDQQGAISLSSPGVTDTRVTVANQFTFDRIFRKGGKVQANIAGSEFGTATTADVLSGKTFTGASGLKKTGTLVPQTGTDTSSATASASDIRKGQTAFGPNGKITGTMPDAGSISGQLGTTSGAQWSSSDSNRGSGSVSITNVNQTAGYTNGYSNGSLTVSVPANRLLKGRIVTPTTSEQTIGEAEDILYGAIKVAGASTLIPSNIKKGVSIFNVTGTMESGTDTSDATATASDIASGKIAYGASGKITGTVADITAGNTTDSNFDSVSSISTYIYALGRFTGNRLFRANSYCGVLIPTTNFGNATAADVASGKTFTSSAGLKVTGTGSSGATLYTGNLYMRSLRIGCSASIICLAKNTSSNNVYGSKVINETFSASASYINIGSITFPITILYAYTSIGSSSLPGIGVTGGELLSNKIIQTLYIDSSTTGYIGAACIYTESNNTVYVTLDW